MTESDESDVYVEGRDTELLQENKNVKNLAWKQKNWYN